MKLFFIVPLFLWTSFLFINFFRESSFPPSAYRILIMEFRLPISVSCSLHLTGNVKKESSLSAVFHSWWGMCDETSGNIPMDFIGASFSLLDVLQCCSP